MAQTATIRTRIHIEETNQFPRAATLYGLKELARRAGVSAEMFRSWRIAFEDSGSITVFVQPGTNRRIHFPHADPWFWGDTFAGKFHTSTAKWMCEPEQPLALLRDFKIPFSTDERNQLGPLFASSGLDCIVCPVDLPTSTMLTLARFEETLESSHDEHGRFSAYSSIAWRDGFLHRPIVDEYGIAFAQALMHLLPGWTPTEKRLRVKLGHDVDHIGIPFSLRSTLGHTLRRNRPLATLRDFLAPAIGIETSYEKLLRIIAGLSRERGLDSAVYWKASAPGPHDSGYDLHHKRIKALIADFRELGVELGIHPGYQTYESEETLRIEVSALRHLLGERRLGGRQDFLRWNPRMWVLWDSLGLAYDASVGFADHIGFRTGTSIPYRPWLISERREADLLEIPILGMDTTLQGYMQLKPEQALSKLQDCVARCRLVGGVFSLVWHNTTLMDRGYALVYRKLLDELAGTEGYDWRSAGDGTFWN
jgi:hypothetical protein